MAEVPFTNGSYSTPAGADTGYISNPRVTNAGAALGEGLSRAGEVAGQISERIEQQNNLTSVQDAMNQFQDHVRNVQYGDDQTPGFFNSQGKSAMSALQPATQGIDQYRRSLMQGMTPTQQRMFNDQSSSFQESAFGTMAAHASRERQQWVDDTQTATLKNYANIGAANIGNPGAFASALNAGRRTIIARQQTDGIPSDSPIAQMQLQHWHDTFLTTAAKTAADGNDPIGAQHILDSNRGIMSAEAYAQASDQLRPAVWDKQAGMLSDSVINGGSVMPVPAGGSQDATFAAMVHNESGGRQTDKTGAPITSGKGAVGIAQVMPDTAREVAQQSGIGWDENRYRNDAVYNRALGQAYFTQLCQRYAGNQTLACAAYNAGPKNVDQWLKDIGDPRTGAISDDDFVAAMPFKETRDYVSRVAATVTPAHAAPYHTAPDISAQEQEVVARGKSLGLPEEVTQRAISKVRQNYNDWSQVTATARDALHSQVNDLSSAYMAGNVTQAVPADQIRQLYPPQEAENTIADLQMRQQAGAEYGQLKWAAPDEVARVRANDSASLQGSDISDFQNRQRVVQFRDSMLEQRAQALSKDPASFVADNPQVQQAMQSIDPNDPATFQQAAQTSLSVQRHLGVVQPRILTNDQASALVQQITSADPAKQDVVPMLDGMEKQYGSLWPQVFGEMVRSGRLPQEYQALANMDTPGQIAGREMFQSNLRLKTDELEKAAGQSGIALKPNSTTDLVSDKLAPFFATTQLQGGGIALNNMTKDAVYRQALGYVARGQDSSSALDHAFDDVIGAKYDLSGTIRAPKGELPAVRMGTQAWLQSLKPSDISMPLTMRGLTQADVNGYTLDRVRDEGKLVMNADESGYNVVLPTRVPGINRTVMSPNGQPLSISLADIRAGRYASPYDTGAQKAVKQAQEAYAAQHPGAN